jgi:sugar phosphate isomerase/epimerase
MIPKKGDRNKMKVAVQTRPWGPEMNREHLSTVLSEIAAAGYSGFEIGAQHLDISQPESFRRLAASHGLEVVGIHVGGEIYDPQSVQEALDNLERIMAFATQVGAPFLPFSGQAKPDKTEAEYRYQAESLNQIGQLCRDNGLTLCYHNHFWEIKNDCTELRYLCDHTDPALVSLCLDVGWVKRAGGSPVEVAEAFFDRIGYFHLKDTTPDEWMEVGYGTVDFPGLFQVIQKRQDWWLVVEQDETRRPPVESARLSREYLKHQFNV